ncbi:hypothetical protein [Streptomyces neyagawaensis]|uniref:hypothetical protein n=1 Tax=Streptomyces neyagawaensis TaxID=42238 RepID=UPI000B1063B4|nr:hypothetical protein [Streptomyces neyagawaensis]MCL6731043.1 hypothetical protein [Streptomyces neyagawaensis]MDE1686235.1 hypothetical protein [Streptomyces neyagawaensis]
MRKPPGNFGAVAAHTAAPEIAPEAARLTKGKARPDGAAPGDEAFNSEGWTAIREAA